MLQDKTVPSLIKGERYKQLIAIEKGQIVAQTYEESPKGNYFLKDQLDDGQIEELYEFMSNNSFVSNAYISDIAKKYGKNKNLKKEFIKKSRIFFPKYEGKIYDPTINKALNILKQNEEQIFNEIHKRNNNINFFKSETYLNNIHDLDKDKKKTQDKIKLLEKENSISMEKLEEIQNRRNAMQYQLEKELGVLEKYKKIRLKRFIDNLNNKEKKELFEEKIKKFQEDSKKLQLN